VKKQIKYLNEVLSYIPSHRGKEYFQVALAIYGK